MADDCTWLFLLLHLMIFFLISAAAAASFCPASCLHAAVSNLEAEQHLSHPATYHSLLSTEFFSLSLFPLLLCFFLDSDVYF